MDLLNSNMISSVTTSTAIDSISPELPSIEFEVAKLSSNSRSDGTLSGWEVAGDTFVVKGVLAKPGTWTDREGKTIDMSKELLETIYENIMEGGNVPIVVFHKGEDNENVGFATQFKMNDNGEIEFIGYIFDSEAQDLIRNGVNKVSGEFIVFEGGESGVLRRVSLVPNPAIEGAGLEKIVKVSMSKGGEEDMEDKEEKFEFSKKDIEKFLKEKGLSKDDIKKLWDMLKELYPYPKPENYPNVKAQEYEEKIKELEAKLSSVNKELEEYRNKELESLISELKEFGVAEPVKIIEGIEDFQTKMSVLKNVKVAMASKPETEAEPSIELSASKPDLFEVAKSLYIPKEYLKYLEEV